MKNPFAIIDIENKTLILAIGGITKTIDLTDLKNSQNFLDEFYHRFKEVNFVSQYKCMIIVIWILTDK